MNRRMDESLDMVILSEDEKANLENAKIVIERAMREGLGETIGGKPIPPAVIERAKEFYRKAAKEMGARDVEFALTADGKELLITFLDVPAISRLGYELRLEDELGAPEKPEER